MSLAILANADRPDETKDQLSVGSWAAFELPSQSFNYRKRRKKFLKLLLVPRLKVCLGKVSAKGDKVTMIISSTLHCNVGTMLQLFETTLQQCCDTLLRQKSLLWIASCNITLWSVKNQESVSGWDHDQCSLSPAPVVLKWRHYL